jgi:hypothetical protein
MGTGTVTIIQFRRMSELVANRRRNLIAAQLFASRELGQDVRPRYAVPADRVGMVIDQQIPGPSVRPPNGEYQRHAHRDCCKQCGFATIATPELLLRGLNLHPRSSPDGTLDAA